MALAPLDLEYQLTAITNYIKANVNDKLAAVTQQWSAQDAADGRTITLDQINSNAFFYQDFGNDVINYDPHVLFRWGTESAATNGPDYSEKVVLTMSLRVTAALVEDNEERVRRLLRYRKAIKSSLRAAFCKFNLEGYRLFTLPDSLLEVHEVELWTLTIGAEWHFA